MSTRYRVQTSPLGRQAPSGRGAGHPPPSCGRVAPAQTLLTSGCSLTAVRGHLCLCVTLRRDCLALCVCVTAICATAPAWREAGVHFFFSPNAGRYVCVNTVLRFTAGHPLAGDSPGLSAKPPGLCSLAASLPPHPHRPPFLPYTRLSQRLLRPTSVGEAMEEVDMENKAKRVSDKLTDSMYILANEPSVALFRLQEHVRKSLPELVEHKVDMQSREQQGQGLIYDVDYAIGAVNNISRSAATFSNVEGLLRKAVAIKQQLNKASSRTSLHTHCFPDPSLS
uniref:Uncharacterized protein LOC116948533 isoform X2 n=2 Tax=Petromyzon marinus TaxID=7757 RepID=A0AAJ7TNA5_PETMA|nr:uncharacterized protein LOC116948533 isoform X2 [Petromyzon marinus]